MKHILFLFTSVLIFENCLSQSLEGVWKGSYTVKGYYPNTTIENPNISADLKIEFILNNDSSYTVRSYKDMTDRNGDETTQVCTVLYRRISSDSIYLEEVKIIKPDNVPTICLQRMHLKIIKRKHSITLEGTWETRSDECDHTGKINIFKKI
jgi:hypothetical protein